MRTTLGETGLDETSHFYNSIAGFASEGFPIEIQEEVQ